MRPTVYVETSIVSYLAAHPSRDLVTAARQQITHTWWRERRQQGYAVPVLCTPDELMGEME